MNSRKIYNKFYSILKQKETQKSKAISCLDFLKEDYKEILNNSFFNKIYEYWWLDYYSETNYYRKRFRAIRSFVNLYQTLDETI